MEKRLNCSCRGCRGCVPTDNDLRFVQRHDCANVATHRIKDWGIGSGALCDNCAAAFARATSFEVIELEP